MLTKIIPCLLIFSIWFSCSRNKCPVDAYQKWAKHWDNKNSAKVHAGLSSHWREITDSSYWNVAMEEAHRKPASLEGQKYKIDREAKVSNEISNFKLIKTKEGWRFAGLPLPVYKKSTPEEAIKSFILAIKFKNYEVLASLLPEKMRVSLSKKDIKQLFSPDNKEILKLIKKLSEYKTFPVIISGNTAVFKYSDNKSMKLVKEDEGWCIIDPD
ncbi:MAG: hypothetical protein ACQES9_06720 [Myxococcota bacterium]